MLLKSSTEFRTAYHNMIHSNSGNPMKDVYNDLQKKFNRDFQYRESFPVCFLRQLAYYEELLGVCWGELRFLVILILIMRVSVGGWNATCIEWSFQLWQKGYKSG